MDRNWPVSPGGNRLIGERPHLVFHDCMAGLVAAVSFTRERRAKLLRIRMGIHAAGGRVLHGIYGTALDVAFAHSRFSSSLDALSNRIRRRPDQAASRPLLARADLPLLPLRNTTPSQPAELVLPPSSPGHTPVQRAVQSFCAGDRSLWAFRSTAVCFDRGRPDYLSSTVAHRERQLLLAELAHRGIGYQRVQRLSTVASHPRAAPADCAASGIRQRIDICACRSNGFVEHSAGAESVIEATAHEL